MQSQNPTPNSGGYDFISNSGNGGSSMMWTNGKPNIKAFALIGGVVLLVIIIIVFVLSSMFGNKTGLNTKNLMAIVDQQQEITRVATSATTSAQLQNTRNLASNIQFTVTGDQQQLITFLGKSGVKVKGLDKIDNKSTDAMLAKAADSGIYDAAYVSLAHDQLTAYQQLLKQEFSTTKSLSEQKIVKDIYNNTSVLIDQATSTASADSNQ